MIGRQHLKLMLRITALTAIVGGTTAIGYLSLDRLDERGEAEARYRHQMEQVAAVTEDLDAVERRLRLLTTSMTAVEHEVRLHLKMVAPGERLVMIQYEGQQ